MDIGIKQKFIDNIKEIDSIFEVSQILKGIYLSYFKEESAITSKYSQHNKLNNLTHAIEHIETSSIKKEEEKNWSRLYTQALVLIVSNSEQIIKQLFENILFSNLAVVKNLGRISFTFEEIQKANFNLTPQDWKQLIKEKIYGESNPREKINFQNVESIIGIFRGYFNMEIKIQEEVGKKIMFFYQCRHLIVHNGSITDAKFVENVLKVLGMSVPLGKKISVDKQEYEECKRVFTEFFNAIEVAVVNSKLAYSEPIS